MESIVPKMLPLYKTQSYHNLVDKYINKMWFAQT